jgi:hypothetical protein
MVTDGHAWALVRYSRDYVEEEREAAAVRAGITVTRASPRGSGAPRTAQRARGLLGQNYWVA